jgi:hypothetical protein
MGKILIEEQLHDGGIDPSFRSRSTATPVTRNLDKHCAALLRWQNP